MIEFRDLAGARLTTVPTDQLAVTGGAGGGAVYRLQFQVVETDEDLPVGSLLVTVDWDDAEPVESVSGARTIVFDEQRTLLPGEYFITVQATNFRLPQPDTAILVFPVTVSAPPQLNVSNTVPFIYGPILPRDTGFPSPANYTFNRGTDIAVLEASVRMLLLTTRGERVAEPEYGTDLVSLLFELDVKDLPSLIEEEIQKALVQWEPRVAVQSVSVRKQEDRSALVDLVCVSKLSRSSFPVSLSFSAVNT